MKLTSKSSLSLIFAAAFLMAIPAQAQSPFGTPVETPQETPETTPESLPEAQQTLPQLEGDSPIINPVPNSPDPESSQTDTAEPEVALEGVLNSGPDYSHLSESQEKAVRLDDLFARLKAESDTESAKLIAEEIWALWLDSGSASVDMLLLRGTAFEKRGATAKARRMYDHVTGLMPDYAEGWARSARLAMEEEDYGRALADAAQALVLEPREFYALWTMGNVWEKLGRTEDAYQAYIEALALYPEHPAIKDRVNVLQSQIDGDVL